MKRTRSSRFRRERTTRALAPPTWSCAARFALLIVAPTGCGSSGAPGGAVQQTASDDARADDAADASPTPPEDGGAVTGIVLDLTTNRPLAGRSVFVEGRSVVTDSAGRFAIPEAASVYDAIVVDADGSSSRRISV